jgi:hypothetical protein
VLLAVVVAVLTRVNGDQTNYFLVAEPAGRALVGDSYVVPITEPDDIAHARLLVSLGPSNVPQPLVGARIAPGKDGFNRDYYDPKLPEWSWHVTEFLRFADFSIEILDGSPSDVESDPAWYQGEDVRRGVIGFWNYTVVRELGTQPLFMSAVSQGEMIHLFWSGLGTNSTYTLECTDRLNNTNWAPVPGATWPLNTNQWTLAATNAPAKFFRVRAESP